MTLPAWLAPVAEAARRMRGSDISRFTPPPGSQPRPGAVLVLFGEGPAGPDLLLTERAHDLRSHPGQVSFPGGSADPGDDGPAATALREAQEETGLDPTGVEVIGTLPELWLPPSNFAVTPVLGWWESESPVGVVDPVEVASVLRVPVEELLDPAHRVTVTHPSRYRSPGFLIGERKDLLLWGFTAMIVTRLFDHVGWTRPWDDTVEVPVPAAMLGPSVVDNRPPPSSSPSATEPGAEA